MKYGRCVVVFAVLLMVSSGLGCVSKKEAAAVSTTIGGKQTQEGDNAAIKNPERKFHRTLSIVMPGDWREIEYQNMLIYLPPGSEVTDPLSEKITVVVGMLPENNTVPLGDILEAGVEESKKLVPDISVISEEEATLGGLGGIKMVFSGTMLGGKIESTQISAMRGNIMYHVVHSCVKDECRYGAIYEEMVESFEPQIPQD